jgi:hypothetical protein
MFLGHVAVALAAKRVTPRLSAAILILAGQFADVLWPFLLAAGVEQVRIDPGNTAVTPLDFVSYPYSHSLLLLTVWGGLLGMAVGRTAGKIRGVSVLALLVVSHWILDVVTHRPDMPLYPGGSRFGLGLWNSLPGTLALEFGLFAAGIAVYLRSTRPMDRIGSVGFWSFAAFLIVVYLASLAGAPPSIPALYLTAMTGAAVMLLWSWWFDRHRRPLAR